VLQQKLKTNNLRGNTRNDYNILGLGEKTIIEVRIEEIHYSNPQQGLSGRQNKDIETAGLGVMFKVKQAIVE
jgi:hypothetical protein